MITFDFLQQLYSFSNYMNWIQCRDTGSASVRDFLVCSSSHHFQNFFFSMAQQPLVRQGILIIKTS